MGGLKGRVAKGGHRKENFEHLLTSPDIETCIERICQFYGLDHAAYHLGYKDMDGVEAPYVRTNYPSQWVGRYVLKNYLHIDPVAKAGYQRTSSTSWADLDWSSEEAQTFLKDAAAHNIGQSGLLVPLVDKNQRRAMANFSNNLGPAQWAKRLAEIQDDLVECAHILHKMGVDELYPNPIDGPSLSPRELECLKKAAGGLEAGDIAEQLALSEHTVRDYLKSARGKLGCSNIAQAMHKATLLRLI